MQKVIQSNPLLQGLREMMCSFKELLKSKQPELLEQWIYNATTHNLSEINSFVKGLRSDIDAVRNAIIYPWTNGFVEGSVNRLKTKKREMYGRDGFELLRRKVVLAKMG
jgi:transposase